MGAAAGRAIAGAAIVIGQQAIATGTSAAIALAALMLLLQRRVMLPEPALVGAAALISIIALR